MNIIGAIIAGLAGTLAMTALMYMAPIMGMPKMDLARMLGSMFTENEGTSLSLGMVVHFMMGVVFSIIYAVLWNGVIGSPTVLWGVIFGVVHAVIVMMIMPMMMRMHPRPPEMAGGAMAMVGQIMGHVVFGVVVALVYAAI